MPVFTRACVCAQVITSNYAAAPETHTAGSSVLAGMGNGHSAVDSYCTVRDPQHPHEGGPANPTDLAHRPGLRSDRSDRSDRSAWPLDAAVPPLSAVPPLLPLWSPIFAV